MATPAIHRKFTRDQYYRMVEVGILHEDDRVELIEGEILDMPPVGPGHQSVTDRLAQSFFSALQGRAIVRVQGPLRISNESEPLPDITLLNPRDDYYRSAHPVPEDVLLLVEISETSLRYDKEVKLPLYAAAGVSEVWIVDLEGMAIEVYSRPMSGRYLRKDIVTEGMEVTPAALPNVTLSYGDILAP